MAIGDVELTHERLLKHSGMGTARKKRDKKQVPFSMAIGHVELTHERLLKHSDMVTARKKQDKKQKNVRKEV